MRNRKVRCVDAEPRLDLLPLTLRTAKRQCSLNTRDVRSIDELFSICSEVDTTSGARVPIGRETSRTRLQVRTSGCAHAMEHSNNADSTSMHVLKNGLDDTAWRR